MKLHLFPAGLKSGWRPLLLWLPVLVLLIGSTVGATRALRSRDSNADSPDNHKDTSPVVVCLGMADFEGGTLSLHPTVPGRVVEVAVAENEVVRKGTVLLRLDDEAARAQADEAEAALQAAEARLAEARKAPRQHQLLLDQQKAGVAAVEHELAAARLM